MEWISVKDQLPNTGDFVIVLSLLPATKGLTAVSFAKLISKLPCWEFIFEPTLMRGMGVRGSFRQCIDMEDITHWMPLPSLPGD